AVTFSGDRVEWREGGTTVHQFTYDSLSELRIDAGPASAPRLIAVDLKNRRWEFALAAGDVARAQGILDIVDGRLQKPVARVQSPALLNPTRVLAWLSIAFG